MEHDLQKLLNGSFEENALNEISQMLEEELSKKPSARDYNKIEELTRAYSELSGQEDFIQEASERGIHQFTEPSVQPRIHMTKKLKLWLTVGAAAAVMLTANIITASAFQMDVFSFIINVADGSFSVDFFSKKVPSESVITIPTTKDDPYGMIAECAKYEIYPETPHYLPDGYVLTLCDYSEMPSYSKEIDFTFTNKYNINQYIYFSYELYESLENIGNTKFPDVEHNLSEIEVNGKAALLAEEKRDKQFTVVTCNGNLLSSFFTQDICKEEVNNIIKQIY